jgi:hypothetical protein
MAQMIESLVESKYLDSSICEDMVFENGDFIAVLDGATDKTDARYAGVAGGRFAVEILGQALDEVAADTAADDCVKALTASLRRGIAEHGPSAAPDDNPSASIVIYSVARAEIWRVGDCSWRKDDFVDIGKKPIDKIVASARAALLQALLAAGSSVDQLRASDPGRAMVLPLLEEQHRFRNIDDRSCDLGFGALDGKTVPARFIEIIPVAIGTEVVFATDGYPELLPTLAGAEESLGREISADPLRIGRHKATKGVAPDQASFDDRAFARFRT